MIKSYEVLNIKCGGCASTVKEKLMGRFPDISVDLKSDPRIVTATINNQEDEKYLIEKLLDLGYPLKDSELGKLTQKYLSSKSYVSCMQGKIKTKVHSK
ncbi:MAG: heavy-metal-associated domain-containing protein [Patescibacteria group bacterium]|jgi:copper chaperone CopZ|nr:heavy-metal-associated domain-containing protein [Patescibacteria group bacterium]